MGKKKQTTTRRDLMKSAVATATAFMFAPSHILGREGLTAPSEKLNLAFIGVGSRGGHNLSKFQEQNVVALCDVDEKYAEKSFSKYEDVPKYKDFRVMLDKHKDVDGVVVSTPDHTHAVAAMAVMERKKHLYVEKPLAHSIHEVRALMKAAQDNNVQTQLGNQGHSYDEMRKTREWIGEGAIGQVKEVQAWYTHSYGNGRARSKETPPVPETLDWDLWLGPARVSSLSS